MLELEAEALAHGCARHVIDIVARMLTLNAVKGGERLAGQRSTFLKTFWGQVVHEVILAGNAEARGGHGAQSDRALNKIIRDVIGRARGALRCHGTTVVT